MNHWSTNNMRIGQCLYLLAVLTFSIAEMPPIFLEEPESAVIPNMASVTLPCKVTPSSAKVRWRFNMEFIEPGKNDRQGFTFTGTNLHITKFKHRRNGINHEGIYECIAETPQGSVTSRPAQLTRAVLKKFGPRTNLSLNTTDGHDVVLPCLPPESHPPANIIFEFNGTIISGSSDHYRILSSGGLQITNTSKSDQGQYHCIAINPFTNQNRTADHVINLNVRTSSAAPSQEAVIITSKNTFTTEIGENVTLECVGLGMPQPTIVWEAYGGELPSSRHKIEKGHLFIWNVQHEDMGTYACKASNGIGIEKHKAVMLEVLEPPRVQAETQFITINPSESVRLRCEITGSPEMQVIWYHNAVPMGKVLTAKNGGTTYTIKHIKPEDGGLYQCMCSNEIGVAYSTIYVEVKGQSEPSTDGDDEDDTAVSPSDSDAGSNGNTEGPGKTDSNRRKNNRRNKKRRRNRKKNKKPNRRPPNDESAAKDRLVPPTAPEVSQLSDKSVKLNWSVPENDGLQIVFFRVQYKIIKPKKGQWKTEDEEIPGDKRMYEVSNLKPAQYKFRIAAVYSNNDNTAGPNSKKFTLTVKKFKQPRAPEGRPTIVKVEPVEYERDQESTNSVLEYGLNVRWKYMPVKTSQIEGFFLYYKPFSSQDEYESVQMMEPTARTYLLSPLQPNTEYSIKIQSFNAAGNSDFSNVVVKRTLGGKGIMIFPPPTGEGNGGQSPTDPENPVKAAQPSSEVDGPIPTNTKSSSEMLYMILGIVLGVMMLFLIVFMFMCWWKQRQQRRMMDAMNDHMRVSKFQDSAQRIHVDSLRKKYSGVNGLNGSVANGHVPNSYTKMNISVNPLTDVDPHTFSNGYGGHGVATTYQPPNSFMPNGTISNHPGGSDNNFNKINRSMDSSLHRGMEHADNCLQQSGSLGDEGCPLQSPDSLGGGEAPACPPSPHSSNVPSCFDQFHSDSPGRYSNSNRSCDQLARSCDQLQSEGVVRASYDSSAVNSVDGESAGKQKRRRRRAQAREQMTRDQATNTDLSSNEGTIEFSTFSKVPSDTHSPDHSTGGHCSPVRTYVSDHGAHLDCPDRCEGV
ncbi:brother of CDO-like isoform X2 [Mizuhopecten yessoensis]|uniref:Interference hedgehog n=1 Tax=Mizuhopecten yessoensis TaxID=6573 RepID=A0A210PHN1_MIZYE|nr:brother of CDO-like isoform X2 [Mizuhopecten yessoensis]OWF35977.1 Interference hedgehog [Mizuhopecten yessoensis]